MLNLTYKMECYALVPLLFQVMQRQQLVFRICHLSIPGIAAHNRCNIAFFLPLLRSLDPWCQLEGSYEIGSVQPSLYPDIFLLELKIENIFKSIGIFFVSLVFLQKTHVKLCITSWMKISFTPKIWKMDQKQAKNCFQIY